MTALLAEVGDTSPAIRWQRESRWRDLRGFKRIEWQRLIEEEVAPARKLGMERKDLANAAARWLGQLDTKRFRRLAILNVVLDGPQAVADLHDYVVVPAVQRGIELLIVADRDLPALTDVTFHEPQYGYPYALHRLHWRLSGKSSPTGPIPELPDGDFVPSPAQAAAIHAAANGVAQIIAPAGSGKTAVLIERVRALQRHGVPPKAIICMTFNSWARKELDRRLAAAGLSAVTHTFHSIGRRIAIDAKLVPESPRPGGLALSHWRRICNDAKKQEGVWIDPQDAKKLLSDIKLKELLTVEQYTAKAAKSKDKRVRAMAVIYRGYHATQKNSDKIDCDFDDYLLYATQVLRNDPLTRAAWQARCQHVLVDEYQDIEPAQELIVRLVAAPEDQLFCVGDEDQTLYTFRRASVDRIICLDHSYPALERYQLDINYRCPKTVVTASTALIGENKVRFPKKIEPDRQRTDRGKITLNGVASHLETAWQIAALLKDKKRGEIAVLSRTTNGLRPVAYACAEADIKIDGHKKLFAANGALVALASHLVLAMEPAKATRDLVSKVCSVPARQVTDEQVTTAVQELRNGESFAVAFAGISAPARDRDRGEIWAPDKLFSALALLAGVSFRPPEDEDKPTPAELLQDVAHILEVTDLRQATAPSANADKLIALLRSAGGLDAWFAESDQLGGTDTFEQEFLEYVQLDAAGTKPQDYIEILRNRYLTLRAARDKEHGIELLTVHGAKGLQWPEVLVVGCDQGMLPNSRSLRDGLAATKRGEGIEAERRIAYVAFTRAQQHLQLFYDPHNPSDFLVEAGLLPPTSRPKRHRA